MNKDTYRSGMAVTGLIGMLVVAVLFFCAAFLFFAHQAGFYRIVSGPAEKKVPRPDLKDFKEMVITLDKEKAALAIKENDILMQHKQLEDLASQMVVEKQALETQKQQIAGMLEEISKALLTTQATDEKNIVLLAKMYAAMNPDDAVKVFEKMSDVTTTAVLMKMKPAVSARILAKMKPSRAGLITERMKVR